MGESGGNEQPIVLQHAAGLGQRFFRLGNDVQRVGYDSHIKGVVRVWEMKHILHGEVELGGAVGQMNHFLRGVRCLDLLRGVYDVTCDKPRAGGQLQHGFVPDSGADQLIHLLIGGHVPAQKAVIVRRVLVPKI